MPDDRRQPSLIGLGALALKGFGPAPVLLFLAACFVAFCLFSRHIRSRTEKAQVR